MCMFATAGTAFVYISLNASKRYKFKSYRPWTFISKSQGPFFRYIIPSQAQVWHKYSLQETTSRYISYKQFMIASSNEIIFALPTLCEGNPPVTGAFPSQRPVARSFDVFFDVRLNKRSSEQSRWRCFEMPWCSLWRHWYVKLVPVNLFPTPSVTQEWQL